MKRISFLAVLVLAISPGAAKADSACSNPSQITSLSGKSSCILGGLTFGNFSAVNSGGGPNPLVVAVDFSTEAGGDVLITFNPNLINPVHDLFTLTGGTDGIDLELAHINQTKCNGLPFTISGFCSHQNTLPNPGANNGFSDQGSFETTSPVYLSEEINVASGGSLTYVGESFATPEPGTLTLFGAGLIGTAGLIRRKLKK